MVSRVWWKWYARKTERVKYISNFFYTNLRSRRFIKPIRFRNTLEGISQPLFSLWSKIQNIERWVMGRVVDWCDKFFHKFFSTSARSQVWNGRIRKGRVKGLAHPCRLTTHPIYPPSSLHCQTLFNRGSIGGCAYTGSFELRWRRKKCHMTISDNEPSVGLVWLIVPFGSSSSSL